MMLLDLIRQGRLKDPTFGLPPELIHSEKSVDWLNGFMNLKAAPRVPTFLIDAAINPFCELAKAVGCDLWNAPSLHFPLVFPPFDDCFMEYAFTENVHSSLFGGPRTISRVGAKIVRVEQDREHPQSVYGDKCAWTMFMTQFEIQRGGGGTVALGPGAYLGCSIDELGSPLGLFFGPSPGTEHLPMDTPTHNKAETLEVGAFVRAKTVLPFLYAISLLNCKNVTSVDASPDTRESAKWKRRYGVPLVKYKVLNVCLDQLPKPRPVPTGESRPLPLHLCRAHFKDFREHGLFGKHKGLFWFPSHARGSLENGEIVKDYRLTGHGVSR